MWLETFNKMRELSGMNLDELAAKSEVPKGTLAKISAGITQKPALETMRSLVHAMGYTLDDLERSPEDMAKKPAPEEESGPGVAALEEDDGFKERAERLIRAASRLHPQQRALLLAVLEAAVRHSQAAQPEFPPAPPPSSAPQGAGVPAVPADGDSNP